MPNGLLESSTWLRSFFEVPPTCGVFAKGGAWERAWFISGSAPPSASAMTKYLLGTEEVAFEIMCGQPFFGLRMTGSAKDVSDFAAEALAGLRSARSGLQFIERMVAAGYVRPDAKLKSLEVGAVFAWRSVGAFRLPPPDVAHATFSDWWPDLQQSQLFRNASHAKALELSLDDRIEHWYGLPLSDETSNNRLSEIALRQGLQEIERCFSFLDRAQTNGADTVNSSADKPS